MVIGITGSIASGKSTVTSYLINKKYNVIDCDEISHFVLTIDSIKEKLKEVFGEQIIVNNSIDRKILGKIIFNNINKKEQLQNIVFPEILSIIKQKIKESNGIIFLDAPLLFEYKLESLTNKIIVVNVSKEEQIKRLMTRDNIDKDYAIKKINSQFPIDEKLKKANYIIDNNKSKENTYYQIEQILKLLEVEK